MLKIVTEWLGDQVSDHDWVTKWLGDWVTEWPSDRMTEWQNDRVTKRPSYQVTKWQEASQTIDRMVYLTERNTLFIEHGLSNRRPAF